MENFATCMVSASTLLKSLGFSKSGTTFWKRKDGNWLVINIQKSIENTQVLVKFTVNLGICSEVIRTYHGQDIRTKPAEYRCHVRKRIGFLLPARTDYWWRVDPYSHVGEISDDVCRAISEYGYPFLEAHASDMQLIQYWTELVASEETGVKPFEELTILMKVYGVQGLEAMGRRMLDDAKGRPYESTARYHLKELGVHL